MKKKKTKVSFDTHLPVPLLLVRCPSINLNLSTHFGTQQLFQWWKRRVLPMRRFTVVRLRYGLEVISGNEEYMRCGQ